MDGAWVARWVRLDVLADLATLAVPCTPPSKIVAPRYHTNVLRKYILLLLWSYQISFPDTAYCA